MHIDVKLSNDPLGALSFENLQKCLLKSKQTHQLDTLLEQAESIAWNEHKIQSFIQKLHVCLRHSTNEARQTIIQILIATMLKCEERFSRHELWKRQTKYQAELNISRKFCPTGPNTGCRHIPKTGSRWWNALSFTVIAPNTFMKECHFICFPDNDYSLFFLINYFQIFLKVSFWSVGSFFQIIRLN